MATAYRVTAQLVIANDEQGRAHHYYHSECGAGDSIIPWLSNEQRDHFLSQGLVTPIEVETQSEVETQYALDRVTECLQALADAGAPADCGAPTAREVLRDNGLKFGNEVIAAAVKARKAMLSRTVQARGE